MLRHAEALLIKESHPLRCKFIRLLKQESTGKSPLSHFFLHGSLHFLPAPLRFPALVFLILTLLTWLFPSSHPQLSTRHTHTHFPRLLSCVAVFLSDLMTANYRLQKEAAFLPSTPRALTSWEPRCQVFHTLKHTRRVWGWHKTHRIHKDIQLWHRFKQLKSDCFHTTDNF